MTRTYAAKRLLEHGPLTFGEFTMITGWPSRVAEKALECLRNSRVAHTIVGDDGLNVWYLS